jgi:hypothetical protein
MKRRQQRPISRQGCRPGCVAHRIIYGSIEVTEWAGGIIASLRCELIEVDGAFEESRGSSRLEAAELETSGP